MFYVLQKNKSDCVFFSLLSTFFFIGDKFADDCFKDKIRHSLKVNDRLKIYQDVALNNARKKVKQRCKLSYKILKEEYGYNILLGISPYPSLIKLKYILGKIHYCVTVVGKFIFESNFPFPHSLAKEILDYC